MNSTYLKEGSVLNWTLAPFAICLAICLFFKSGGLIAAEQNPKEALLLYAGSVTDVRQFAFHSNPEGNSGIECQKISVSNTERNPINRSFVGEKTAIIPKAKKNRLCDLIVGSINREPDKRFWQKQRVGCSVNHNETNAKFGFHAKVRIAPKKLTLPISVIHPLLTHQIGLLFYGRRLFFNGPEGVIRSSNAAKSDNHQQKREERDSTCKTERPSLNQRCGLFIYFGFGGILCAFCATEAINENWRILRSALQIYGISSGVGGMLFWFLSCFVYPYSWGLPPQLLPKAWQDCQQNQEPKDFRHRESVSQKVLTSTGFVYYTNYMANVLSADKQIAIISSLCEGSSIRSVERITGVHRDTIMRLGVKVGQGCTALMDAKMRNLDCHRLEMDEIWGYVGKKEKHLHMGDDPQLGNVWTFCAIDADTKLVPAFHVARERDVQAATTFVSDVASRLNNRVQISTDGLSSYVDAIESSFGKHNVDYAQIIKVYGTEASVEAQRRYSAPKITDSEKKAVFGYPDWDFVSTSYVERLNATTRLHVKRLARLTHAFSKKRENFTAAVGLHFAYYNFVRRHNTLRCTPAMAAGVEQSFWSVGDLVEAVA